MPDLEFKIEQYIQKLGIVEKDSIFSFSHFSVLKKQLCRFTKLKLGYITKPQFTYSQNKNFKNLSKRN